MRKIVLIFIALTFSLAAHSQDLVILHMNDTHSHIDPERSGKNEGHGGVIEQAAYIDEVRKEVGKRNVLLLHAGDFSQGTSYFTELGGDIEIDVLNAMGFDVVTLGNHEFDNGIDELARRLSSLESSVVCANYDFSDTPLDEYIKPYVILRKGGKKIGVIGLLADLSDLVDASVASELEFQDPAQAAQKYASLLKEEGCDIVICLTHLGYDGEPYTDVQLAAATRDIDVVVGGHSHTRLDDYELVKNPDGKDVVIVTDWKWGLMVGRLDIEF